MPEPDMLTVKISRGFDYLDCDGDGLLTEHDHVLCGQRVAASLGHAPGSDSEQKIIEAYVAVWRDLHLPHAPTGSTSISKEQFVTSTRTLAEDPEAAVATVGALAAAFLGIADADNDGYVNSSEFAAFLRGHFPGLSEADTQEAFQHLDLDGSGRLSSEEFKRAIIEYWSSTDPDAPGNWWMGRPSFLLDETTN